MEELGGFTLHGIVHGSWRNPASGEMVREESFPYSVAVSGSDLSRLRSFLRQRAKTAFDQQTIYFGVRGKVEFL